MSHSCFHSCEFSSGISAGHEVVGQDATQPDDAMTSKGLPLDVGKAPSSSFLLHS